MKKKLTAFDGTLVIVSHDRALLDGVCTRVIEIENSKINEYDGNFTNYENQKKNIFERASFEYVEYISEKNRLKNVINETRQKSKVMRKTPKRMGNSEARLHTRAVNSKKKKLDGMAEALKSRISQLEVKGKPYKNPQVRISVSECERIHSRAVVSCESLCKSFGEKVIFDNAAFEIPSTSKTAIIGLNGSGKTTLIKMIFERESGIRVSERAKIGYFSQNFETLDYEKNILENVFLSSVYSEAVMRNLLAGLLFRRDEVYKKVSNLSGGERVKVALAKILLGGFNFLVLDEPTNYLDALSLSAFERVLVDYDGAILISSHDRRFINAVVNRILIIDDKSKKIITKNYTV